MVADPGLPAGVPLRGREGADGAVVEGLEECVAAGGWPLAGSLDVHHGHPAGGIAQQDVRNMPPGPVPARPREPERLSRDRRHQRVEVSQHDPGKLQPALIGHQPADGS